MNGSRGIIAKMCGRSKGIDSACRNVAFILGKRRRLSVLNGKSARSRNDSIKKSSDHCAMPITVCKTEDSYFAFEVI